MRPAFVTIVASFAALASAAWMDFEFPETFPMQKRQDVEPGSPQYDCHAHCGGIITMSRVDGYCNNSTYTEYLQACLACALEYDIWKYYGSSVSKAAEACGDDATPSSAVSASSAESTVAESTQLHSSSALATEASSIPTPTHEPTTKDSAATPEATSSAATGSVTSATIGAPSTATSGTPSAVSVTSASSFVSTYPSSSSNATASAATSTPSAFEGSAAAVYADSSLLFLSAVVAFGIGLFAFNAEI